MNRQRLPIIALCCLLLFGIVVQAEDLPVRPRTPFSQHDLDGDGYISLQEYRQFREHYRARWRHRGNQAGPGAGKGGGQRQRYRWGTMRFVEIDTNRDGLISEQEMLDALNRRYQRPCPRQ